MTRDYKDYLGAIEVEIDGLQYEIGLREEGLRCFRGLWTCMTCSSKTINADLRPNEGEAIELAMCELTDHHDKMHCHVSVKAAQ